MIIRKIKLEKDKAGQLLRSCLTFSQNLRLKAKQVTYKKYHSSRFIVVFQSYFREGNVNDENAFS